MPAYPLTVAQIADYLQADHATVSQLVAAGMPAHELIDGTVRFLVEEVHAWVRDRPTPKTPLPNLGDAAALLSIEVLDLGVRSYNCLMREGLATVGMVAARSKKELLDIRNMTPAGVNEISNKIERLGLALRSDRNANA